MSRAITTTLAYAIAFAGVAMGTDMAPSMGWPVTVNEMNGCILITIGMVAKCIGHAGLLGIGWSAEA